MSTPQSETLQPFNLEAENATLGALILNPRTIYAVAPVLASADFYAEKNRQVYDAIMHLHNQGQPCDTVTLSDHLTRYSANGVAWIDYLGQLIEYTPDEEAAVNYAHIVVDKATRRRLIAAASRINKLARAEEGDIEQQLGEAETIVFQARQGRTESKDVLPEDYVRSYLDRFEELRLAEREIAGIPTGYIDLDRLLNGLHRGKHYAIGGRPGMGKSSLALGIAENAVKAGFKVALFSMEMSSGQIMDRRVSTFTGIDSQRLQRPWILTDEEAARVYEAVGMLEARRLFIDTESGLTPSRLRAKAMRLHAEHGLDMVIVDHFHLLRSDVSRNRKDLEMDESARTLTGIYKTLDVAGITVAQLNRNVESRADKRPLLSDFREVGALEEEAYAALLIYRDDYYNPDTSTRPNIGEVNVAKHREGPTGNVDLFWEGRTVSFKNLAFEPSANGHR